MSTDRHQPNQSFGQAVTHVPASVHRTLAQSSISLSTYGIAVLAAIWRYNRPSPGTFTAEQMWRAYHLPRETVRAALTELEQHGFISSTPDGDHYQLSVPADPAD